MSVNYYSAASPVTRRVRAYFAPVNRVTQTASIFDPAEQGSFSLDSPPAPWIDLGWIENFTRKAASKTTSVLTGAPTAVLSQVRETLEAQVSFQFLSWTKLTMALATGSQHMNLLAPGSGAAPQPLGAQAVPAVSIMPGSSATTIQLAVADAAGLTAGSLIAVDTDYTGQTGFVGAPYYGAYIRTALTDVDYIRRITFNVALVSQVSSGTLTLAQPLPGGAPVAGAKLQVVKGFADREGGVFLQEWSALFVMEGTQGERIMFHYPRLQSACGAEELTAPIAGKNKGSLERMLLKGDFLALPLKDSLDGERVVCYRSFLPAANALV